MISTATYGNLRIDRSSLSIKGTRPSFNRVKIIRTSVMLMLQGIWVAKDNRNRIASYLGDAEDVESRGTI